VAFRLSVNPRRDCSRFPFAFGAKNRICWPGDEATSRSRPSLGINGIRPFFSPADARVGGVEWEFLVGVVGM